MPLSAKAQFTDGMTGLLNMPSAEMNQSGTFTITNNFLNHHISPARWSYNTFGYGFGITFWSRLEVNYVCTIFNHNWGKEINDIIVNQDRHFNFKVLALREGEFGKSWVPALAFGAGDPLTAVNYNGYFDEGGVKDGAGNGFFQRFYVALSKHFDTGWGEVGAHLAYQYSVRTDWINRNAPCAAVTWRPVWLRNRWFDPKFVLEFDARTPNFGFTADIWDSRFQAMFCLQNFQWVSFGLRFKLRLKGSE